MKWITHEHVKVDRVACPWLIKKFIDKDAEFLFVPTRQAYTMALVDPEERTAAASVTSLARSLGSATNPVVSGLLLQGPLLVLGLPFVLAGALKAAYDLTLWSVFRRVHLQEEESHQ